MASKDEPKIKVIRKENELPSRFNSWVMFWRDCKKHLRNKPAQVDNVTYVEKSLKEEIRYECSVLFIRSKVLDEVIERLEIATSGDRKIRSRDELERIIKYSIIEHVKI